MGCGCPHPIILGMVPCDQNSLETHSLPIHSESHCLFSPCNKDLPGADVLVGPFGLKLSDGIRRVLSWVIGHPAPPGAQSLCSTTRDRPGPSGCLRRQGPSIMRIGRFLGRAGAEHHAHQPVFGEGRGRASCASAGVWGGQGPSIMRISGCLGSFKSSPIQVQRNYISLDLRKKQIDKSTGGRKGGRVSCK